MFSLTPKNLLLRLYVPWVDLFFDGKILTVAKYHNKSGRKKARFTNVYVKNLDLDFTVSSLLAKFSEYGKVMSAVIVNDAERKSRGFGFVNFDSHENPKKAKNANSEEAKNATRSLNDCITMESTSTCRLLKVKKNMIHLQTLASLQYMFPFRDMVPKPDEKEDLVPNYQELLEKQVEKENRVPKLQKPLEKQVELEDRVPSLLKPLGNQVETKDRVPSFRKPLENQADKENQDPYMQVVWEKQVEKENRVPILQKSLKKRAKKDRRVKEGSLNDGDLVDFVLVDNSASNSEWGI